VITTGASKSKEKSKHSLPSAVKWTNRVNKLDNEIIPEDLL